MDKEIINQAFFIKKAAECLPKRLTLLYFKIYYKEENYLEVRTAVFKYITPPYSKRFSILVY